VEDNFDLLQRHNALMVVSLAMVIDFTVQPNGLSIGFKKLTLCLKFFFFKMATMPSSPSCKKEKNIIQKETYYRTNLSVVT